MNTLPPNYEYWVAGVMAFMLINDAVIGKIIRKRNPLKWKNIRWGMVLGYVFLGIVFSLRGNLPVEVIAPPCFIAAALSFYINFVLFRVDNKDNKGAENPYKRGVSD